MASFYACIDKYWYQPVAEAGRGDDAFVKAQMAKGRELVGDVQSGRAKNEVAIAHWKTLVMAAKRRALAEAEAMQAVGQSLQRTADQMRPRQCNTIYSANGASTSCY